MANKKQIIIPIVILAAGIAGMAIFSNLKKPPEEKPKKDETPIVAVSKILVAPMTLKVSSYGMVKAKYETELIAQVSGEVVELSDVFLRGSFVKKNQLLARIDPNDYQAALIDAQAAMATARATLEKEVAQGKVAEREWQKITDTSPTELSLRKPQLAQELARVKAAQAAVLRAERNLERTEIRAPYDALIDSRNIGLGAFVGIGNRIGHLLATDTAEIRLPVADNQLEYLINQGVNAQVKLEGVYAGKTTQWLALIKRNEGVIDNKSRMTYLVAELDDPYLLNSNNSSLSFEASKSAANELSQVTTKQDDFSLEKSTPLRFGSYVNAKIIGNQIAQATTIPRYLVNNGKVAILANDSTLHYATIDIVREQGASVIVGSGLKNGDRLIISALDYPVDGMKLGLIGDEIAEAKKGKNDNQPDTNKFLTEANDDSNSDISEAPAPNSQVSGE